MRRIRSAVLVPILLAVSAGAVGGSLFLGSEPWANVTPTILYDIRLGRAVLAFLAGAALALAGAVFQGLFRNPLADPFVGGVSGGAALGAVIVLSLDVRMSVFGLGIAVGAAFAGGLGAALLGWALARVRGRVPVSSLLLAGFAIGTFSSAMVSLLLLTRSKNWNEVISWLMGFVNDTNPWDRVWVLLPCVAASGAVMMAYARDLDLMLFGEESAQQLGLEVERSKLLLLTAAAAAASAAVATCGIIGFVGLVVPHVGRALVGPGHRGLLPVAFLAGGVLLTLADGLARVIAPDALPVGVVTALCGAPFFLHLLRRGFTRA